MAGESLGEVLGDVTVAAALGDIAQRFVVFNRDGNCFRPPPVHCRNLAPKTTTDLYAGGFLYRLDPDCEPNRGRHLCKSRD